MYYLRIYQGERMFDVEVESYNIRGSVIHFYKEEEEGDLLIMTEAHEFTSVFVSDTPTVDIPAQF